MASPPCFLISRRPSVPSSRVPESTIPATREPWLLFVDSDIRVETPGWAEELGDVLFSLACVANLTGVDLNQALDSVVRNYERRLAERGDAGSG